MPHTEKYQPFNHEKKLGSGKLVELLRTYQVKFDANYFKPDEYRTREYLQLDRSMGISTHRWIPVGRREWVHYYGKVTGLVGDRPIASYQHMLFPDVFSDTSTQPRTGTFTTDFFLSEMKRKDDSQPMFGGYDGAFKPGNVVLDIASGEAVALTQLSLQFPQTVFIGIDRLYQTNRKIFTNRVGLQLTGDDWRFLKQIPDNSVDTILSCQGVNMWGLPFSFREDVTDEDGINVVRALERISKPGTVIRFDDFSQGASDYLTPLMAQNWQIEPNEDIFIAKKIK